jgi:3-oxoacyl-(acyl-carrier-protein) synthase III
LLTNADLEKMVETNDQWIQDRTGIRQRHLVDKGVATSDLAAEAARDCLRHRGIEASDLDAILVATVTPDMMFPATACLVQEKIGAKGAWGFDLSAACSGFIYALQLGAKLVESGAHAKVMVIGADVFCSNLVLKAKLAWSTSSTRLTARARRASICRAAEACTRQLRTPFQPRCTSSTRRAARCSRSRCARWPS